VSRVLTHTPVIVIHDNPHSLRKEIPTNKFLAPLPAEAHLFVCFFLGGIVNELAQSLLPVSPPPPLFLRISDTLSLPSTRPSHSVTRRRPSSPIILASLSAFKKSNLLSAGIGVYVCYHLEKYCRRKREVQACPSSPRSKVDTITNTSAVDLEVVSPPFSIQLALGLDSESDEENESGTQLLPLHNDSNTSPPHCPGKPTTTRRAKRSARCELGAGRR